MASRWASIAIFLAILSFKSAESRVKPPPIFPPRLSASASDHLASDTPSSNTPSQDISGGVRVHRVPRAAVGVDAASALPAEFKDRTSESLVGVHHVPKASNTPSQDISGGVLVHPVPRAAAGFDISSAVQTKDGNYLTSGAAAGVKDAPVAPNKN